MLLAAPCPSRCCGGLGVARLDAPAGARCRRPRDAGHAAAANVGVAGRPGGHGARHDSRERCLPCRRSRTESPSLGSSRHFVRRATARSIPGSPRRTAVGAGRGAGAACRSPAGWCCGDSGRGAIVHDRESVGSDGTVVLNSVTAGTAQLDSFHHDWFERTGGAASVRPAAGPGAGNRRREARLAARPAGRWFRRPRAWRGRQRLLRWLCLDGGRLARRCRCLAGHRQ